MKRGNQTIFYDVESLQSGVACQPRLGASNNPSTLAHAGDGFMMRQGYTLVWSVERRRLPVGGRLTTNFPVAKNPDGSPIRRRITTEFVFRSLAFRCCSVSSRIPRRETLSCRRREHGESAVLPPRRHSRAAGVVPADEWSFARCPDGKTRRK